MVDSEVILIAVLALGAAALAVTVIIRAVRRHRMDAHVMKIMRRHAGTTRHD